MVARLSLRRVQYVMYNTARRQLSCIFRQPDVVGTALSFTDEFLGSPTLVGRLKLYCCISFFLFFTGLLRSAAAARPASKCIPEVRS